MTETDLMKLLHDGMIVTLLLTLPPLVAGLVVGLAVALVQALTSVQEVTLTFIPKLLAVFAVMILLQGWMLRLLIDYSLPIFGDLAQFAGR